jgi:taurine dioxygenase
MQHVCEGLNGVHSAKLPYGRDGAYARETGTRTMQIITGEAAEATQLHPLVRVHPVTGAKALFCSPTYTIGLAVGTQCMTSDEGYAILTFLFRHIVEERFLYRHRWAENMLLMWDNRRMLHFAEGGYDGHLRLLHRTTLAGEAPIKGH